MIYGVLDNETSKFTFVRAGHPKPWLLNKSSVSTIGLKDNLMLGIFEKEKFKEETVVIEEGARLILFTDGLIDTGRKSSGYEKEILEIIKQVSETNSVNILDKIEEDIKMRLKHEKHQDDICVLIIERLEN